MKPVGKHLDIPLHEISDFPDHPFKVRMDENMMKWWRVSSSMVYLSPLWCVQNRMAAEMIAGHRRKMASELAGKSILSCIVRDMTDDEAIIVMLIPTCKESRYCRRRKPLPIR